MRIVSGIALSAAFALISLGQAHALITGLYNTGQESSGGIDSNWTVSGCINFPSCTSYVPLGGPAYVINPPAYLWLANTATSSWISDAPNTYGGTGPFTYETTFSASSTDSVVVDFAADDEVEYLSLNGSVVHLGDIRPPNTPWSYSETFTLSGFANGSNLLQVLVPNIGGEPDIGDGPTGLRVQFGPT